MTSNPVKFLVAAFIALSLNHVSHAVGSDIQAGVTAPQTTSQAPVAIPTGAKSATKAELDAIRTQNALEAERMKGLKGSGSIMSGGPGVPALDARSIAITANNARAGNHNAGVARVTMVAGPQGQLAATIQTAEGLIVARSGDRIPGVGVIRSVTVNQVLVQDGKRLSSLPFAPEPASSVIQGSSPLPGAVGMPISGMLPGGM